MNTLYYGDNLDVMRRHLKDESVDLVYLDPPFNSNTNYNVLFQEHDATKSSAQVIAFEDTWHWDQTAALTYEDALAHGGRVADGMIAFRTFLGTNDMLAYLSMMAPRLVELRRVLKPTGSIYLHCDPTASHYLKILMDAIFGPKRFENEIIWSYRSGGASKSRFAKKHDVLLCYSSSQDRYFNVLRERSYNRQFKPYRFKGVEEFCDEEGRWYTTPFMRDVWEINMVGRTSSERLGYPTQKPLELLERIIESSCPPDGIVLDPFCGCGTAIEASQVLGRQWIGIDVTHLAIGLIRHRLSGIRVQKSDFTVIGEPTDVAGAQQLAKDDPYQFQWWALGLVGARPTPKEQKKGTDRGIDGRLYFHDDNDGDTKQVIFSVKAGKVQPSYVRDLVGVLNREKAQIGVLVSLIHPTREMRTEAGAAGCYQASGWNTQHPRIQLITIEELLSGTKLDLPLYRNRTLKKPDRNTQRLPRSMKRTTRALPDSLFDDNIGATQGSVEDTRQDESFDPDNGGERSS